MTSSRGGSRTVGKRLIGDNAAHDHAAARCRPARRGRADAGLRARHRPSRCARAGRHRHDGAAPRGGRPRSPPPATKQAGLRPRRHRHRRQHAPALRPLRRQPPLRRQADLRPAPGARRRAQRGRLHHSRVGRGAGRTVHAGRRRARAASRAPAPPGAGPYPRHAGDRRRDRRASGRRRRRRGGLVRRARRAAHRRPAAGACARPRAGLARARARAVATPHRLSGPELSNPLPRRLLMRRVTYSMSVSVDGYIVGPDGGFDWTAPDEEVFRFWIDEIREVGVHLLGRRLYETMLYWETADQDRSLDDAELEWAALWKPLPKVVFSTTLSEVQGNARLASGGLAEEIERLRDEPGEGEIAIGGATLAAEAAALGLIDEYRAMVHPVLVGGGIPFFPQHERRVDLELVETRTFSSRVVYLCYRVAR